MIGFLGGTTFSDLDSSPGSSGKPDIATKIDWTRAAVRLKVWNHCSFWTIDI
jgi:hypothetical protein